jgi:hypothetical protein
MCLCHFGGACLGGVRAVAGSTTYRRRRLTLPRPGRVLRVNVRPLFFILDTFVARGAILSRIFILTSTARSHPRTTRPRLRTSTSPTHIV